MPVSNGLYYTLSGPDTSHLPPVLFLHGAGSSHLCWPPRIRRLNQYKTICLDLPGHGRSTGTAQQTISAYTGPVIDFIHSLGLYQIILVGHSMGGAIAQQIALAFPKMVSGIGLVATGAYLGGKTEILEYLSNPNTLVKAMELLQQKTFGPDTSPALMEEVFGALKKTRPGVLYSDWLACANFDIHAEYTKLDIPAWIICGSADLLTPLSYSQFLASQFTKAVLQIIPNAGHMVMLESEAEFHQGLLNFLDQIQAL